MKLHEFFSAKQFSSLLSPGTVDHQARYESFRSLLNHNRAALRAMAELEQLYYSDHPIDARTVRQHYAQLVEHVLGLTAALNNLSDGKFSALPEACRSIEAAIAEELAPRRPSGSPGATVLALSMIGPDQLPVVGGKAFNLAVMKNLLKLPVPDGFVMTTAATDRFLADDDLKDRIREELAQLSPEDIAGLEAGSTRIRQQVMDKPVPADLAAAIAAAYAELEARTRPGVRIAMRSSAVGEDGAASFAGQYSTVLNVTRDGLLDAFKRVVASKYSPRAISYRQLLGLDDEDTPMCVIGMAMIDAHASGVMYTLDPATGNAAQIKVSSLWGLGEQLVGGDATPDSFLVDKASGTVIERHVAKKATHLVAHADGGTRLEETGADKQTQPSLSDQALRQLCAGAQHIEAHYRTAQDIEWAIDADERLFFLQARPLHIEPEAVPEPAVDFTGLDNLLQTGIAASRGIAAGRVFIAHNEKHLADIPDHAILVTPTASPAFAAIMGRIDALITEAGSITSHLASVAREFGIPAIMEAHHATALPPGEMVTVVAESRVGVLRGVVDALREHMRPAKKRYVGSPAHRKLRTLLDHVAPLNLTDSRAPDFSVAGCRTFHDVIRLCHEYAMRAMFDLSSAAEGAGTAIKVVTHLPIAVYLIDLGGGLLEKGPGRRSVTPADFASLPLRAIWQGMTHPGVSWEGTVNFAKSRFMSIMASIATSDLGPEPGGDSYVLASHDYMNFSAKFGYHFATVDALCGVDASHNYVTLQFAGGAGNFFGRSLRIQFLGAVLERLGFEVALQGDLIEASFSRHGLEATQSRLDQLGRLLASCRLLDMILANEEAVDTLVAAFMAGDYDLLKPRDATQPENFYLQQGHWSRRTRDDRICLYQSGRASAKPVARAPSGLIGKAIGTSYQELLNRIGAYFYFPLAIAKNSEMTDGSIAVELMSEGGIIDRAGGIIFGLKNAANYFVFRINALEHNAILFEFVNGKRSERGRAALVVRSGRWYRLRAEIADRTIRCGVDGQVLVEYRAEAPIRGHVGVWTKADSATWFRPLTVETSRGTRVFEY